MKTAQPNSIYRTADAAGGGAAPSKNGVAVSSTNTAYSTPWSYATFGLHLEWTGTPTGVLTFWMSDKEQPDLTSDADWVQDTGFAPTNPAGSAGKMRDDVANANARWKRIKYVNASGSGTLFGFVTSANARA